MADFKIAEKITGKNEGGYANNHADRGGETYCGIARNFWGKWKGWSIIDLIKKNKGDTAKIINLYAKADSNMDQLVSEFYKDNFWNVNKLNLIQDQQLANSIYDFGVNAGTGRASKFLQNVLGLKEDGAIGIITITEVNMGNPKTIHTAYNCKREGYYRGLAKGTQAQFLKSWLSRLKLYA